MKNIIAIFAGGFKPPTKGHFEIAKQALENYPEIESLYVFIGGGIRDNINQTQSLDIWNLYLKYLPKQIKIKKISGSPIKEVINITKENPNTKVYLISGTRKGDVQGLIDYQNKLKLQNAYKNLEVKNITKDLDISGTKARQTLNKSREEFFEYLPNELTPNDKIKVYNILKSSLVESINHDTMDRLEFYKQYYKNLSPSDFEVNVEGDNIIIGGVVPKTPIKIVFNMFESIKPQEAHSDTDSVQTLIDGKRQVAFIVEKANTSSNWENILSVIEEHNLQMLPVKGNPYKAFVVYVSEAESEAMKLKELAEKYDGYLASNANEEDTREIGRLLGYHEEDIEKYISDRNINEYIKPADEQTVDPQELEMGIKVEMEHTQNPKIAKTIALQHLAEDPKYYTKLATLNLEENQNLNFGYRAGGFNPEFPSERLKDRGIGLVNSKVGLLGTGYFFVGDIEAAKKLSKELGGKYNTISKIDLSKYKMFRPDNPTEFYEGIRDTTFYLNGLSLKDLKEPETQENIEDAIDIFSDYLNLNRAEVEKIFEEYLKDIIKKKDGDLLSNRLLFNYDGIDLRGTPYDDFGAGSLIFNGKLKEGTYETISLNSLNENATYSEHIDYKQQIKDLTKHMLNQGMNITPLPKVVFKHKDVKNAKNFLGKTAYYDPNTQTIILYTEGRHPKDIVRSFSHEMIHHKQNLEGRLGDIQTTNTQEDDNLNDIEAEANLGGTMTFRNWTDSLNKNIEEKKNKDPFGLNQYARELAQGLEEELSKEYIIYSDMDGVLTDFDSHFYKSTNGIFPSAYEAKYGTDEFWRHIDNIGIKFWTEMPWMSDGKIYWDYIKKYNPKLLSAPSHDKSSKIGKHVWVKNHLPGTKLILSPASQKQRYASPNIILIDDKEENIKQWRKARGIGILHTSAENTIEELKKLGL